VGKRNKKKNTPSGTSRTRRPWGGQWGHQKKTKKADKSYKPNKVGVHTLKTHHKNAEGGPTGKIFDRHGRVRGGKAQANPAPM